MRGVPPPPSVIAMEQLEQTQVQADPQPLGKGEFFAQILHGIGIAAGMGLLWIMETVRNAYFRMLDRFNIKSRKRTNASAFPPGRSSRSTDSPSHP